MVCGLYGDKALRILLVYSIRTFFMKGTGSFPEVKRPGRGFDHPPQLAPRLKKEPLWAFVVCSSVKV